MVPSNGSLPIEDIVYTVFTDFATPLKANRPSQFIKYSQMFLKWKPQDALDGSTKAPYLGIGNFTPPVDGIAFKLRWC
jgi:hypothetical protein